MFPEGILVRVCLMIVLTIQTLEKVGAWFSLLCFKSKRVSFEIHFTTSSEIIMMFRFMETIALYAFKF